MEEKEKHELETQETEGLDSKTKIEVEESAEELKAKLTNVVEELQKERQQKGVYKELYEKVTTKQEEKTPIDEDEITKKVKEVLGQFKASEAQDNKKSAFEKFITEHKEFHPGNDITGMKRMALEQKVNAFNTSGLTKYDEFYSVIRDAYKLLGGSDTTPEPSKEVKNPYSDTPIVEVTPKESDTTGITQAEKALYERNGWTKEKFLSIRAKNPDLINQLTNKSFN